jgi:hypothetical protein
MYSSLYTPYSHKPSSKLLYFPILLAKSALECLPHALQTCTKTCTILKAKQMSFSSHPLLAEILGSSKQNLEDK